MKALSVVPLCSVLLLTACGTGTGEPPAPVGTTSSNLAAENIVTDLEQATELIDELEQLAIVPSDDAEAILAKVQAALEKAYECSKAVVEPKSRSVTIELDGCEVNGTSYTGEISVEFSRADRVITLKVAADLSNGTQGGYGQEPVESVDLAATITVKISRELPVTAGIAIDMTRVKEQQSRHITFAGTAAFDREGQTLNGSGEYDDGTWAGAFVVTEAHRGWAACYPDGGVTELDLVAKSEVEIELGQFSIRIRRGWHLVATVTFDDTTAQTGEYVVKYTLSRPNGEKVTDYEETRAFPWDCPVVIPFGG